MNLKDVTVALELTLPEDVSDQEIRSFVEGAIKEALRSARYDAVGQDMDKVDWIDGQHGVLGIYEHMIDVVGIVDSCCEVTPYGDAIKAPRRRQWRMFQRK